MPAPEMNFWELLDQHFLAGHMPLLLPNQQHNVSHEINNGTHYISSQI